MFLVPAERPAEPTLSFYQIVCCWAGCTMEGNLVAASQSEADRKFATHGWQIDPPACPTHRWMPEGEL